MLADPALAREYLAAGQHALNINDDPVGALQLLDTSLRLDYIAALNDCDVLEARCDAFHLVGRDQPFRSLLLYNHAGALKHLKLWSEAAEAYLAAAKLDPLFAWHLNNLAWEAATSTDEQALSGRMAVFAAERACSISGWGCWSFLNTLAAAYARVGETKRAVGWQAIALELSPLNERSRGKDQLRAYKAGRAWIDADPKVAAGDIVTPEDIAELNVETIRREVRQLIEEFDTTSTKCSSMPCSTMNQ